MRRDKQMYGPGLGDEGKRTNVSSKSISISRKCPRPSTILSIIFIIQVVPSLQGVH